MVSTRDEESVRTHDRRPHQRLPLQDGTNKANSSPQTPISPLRTRNSFYDHENRIKKTSLQVPASPDPAKPSSPSSAQLSPPKTPLFRPQGPRALPASSTGRGSFKGRPHSSMGFDRSPEFEMTEKGKDGCEIKININRSPQTTPSRCDEKTARDPSRGRPQSALVSPLQARKEEHRRYREQHASERHQPPRWIAPSIHGSSAVANNLRIKTHVGPWKLGCTIGKGTTSRVRVAKHRNTGVTAAIKIIPKKTVITAGGSGGNAGNDGGNDGTTATDGKDAGGIRKRKKILSLGVQREVVIMKLMEHPNIIQLHDVWQSKGELFLILEYAPSGSLFTYLSNQGALSEQQAMRLFRQIIGAVSSIHSYNICHRDLKPENILLDSEMNVKIADFGMAAFQPANTMLTTSCGSPHYAAPEVIVGKPYRGDKADIWSCGVILYVMLAGYLPFDSGDVDHTLSLVVAGDYVIPPWFGRSTRNLIQSMLRRRPGDRLCGREVLKHPALRKYARDHRKLFPELEETVYGDELLGLKLAGKDREMVPASVDDIDEEIFGAMMLLWEGREQEMTLLENLLNDEVNHEKLFYKGLLDYRTAQLEQNKEYLAKGNTSPTTSLAAGSAAAGAGTPAKNEDMPMLAFPENSPIMIKSLKNDTSLSRSQSQLYGPRPRPESNTAKRLSQQQKPSPTTITHTQRTIPVAPSYDPYRASRMKLIDPNEVEHMKVTVYPPKIEVAPRSRLNLRTAMIGGRTGLAKAPSKRGMSSLGSNRSTSGSVRNATPVSTRGKRNVSFQNVREVSNNIRKNSRGQDARRARRLEPHGLTQRQSTPPVSSSSRAFESDPRDANQVSNSPPLPCATPPLTLPTPPPAPLLDTLYRNSVSNELHVRRKRVKNDVLPLNATLSNLSYSHDLGAVTIPTSMTMRQKQYEMLQDALRKASDDIEWLCEQAFNRVCAHGDKAGKAAIVAAANANAQNQNANSALQKPGSKLVGSLSDSTSRHSVAMGDVTMGVNRSSVTPKSAAGKENVQRDGGFTEGSSSPVPQGSKSKRISALRHANDKISRSKIDQKISSAQISASASASTSASDSPPTSTPSTPFSDQEISVINSLLKTKDLMQSKKATAWISLEAALKSLETLCPETPFTSVQVPHPSLAPPSPTLEQLKDLQRNLKKHTMETPDSNRSLVFEEVQQRIREEIAKLEQRQQALDAQRDSAGIAHEEQEGNADIDVSEESPELAANIADWNPNIARLTHYTQGLTDGQAADTKGKQPQGQNLAPVHAPFSEGASSPRSSIYDDILIDESGQEKIQPLGLNVRPLTIKKKKSNLEEEGNAQNEQAGEPKHDQCEQNGTDEGQIHYDLPILLRPNTNAPKKATFQSNLEPIAEYRTSSQSTASKRSSTSRIFSWTKRDDESTKAEGRAKGAASASASTLPAVPENSGNENVARRSSSVRRTRSKKRTSRFRSLFSRQKSVKKAGKSPQALTPNSITPKPSRSNSRAPLPSGRPMVRNGGSASTSDVGSSRESSVALGTPTGPMIPQRKSSKSRSWSRLSIQHLFAGKPVIRVIALEPDHLKAAKAVRKILRTWKSYGLKDLRFDKEANTFTGQISSKNSFNLASLEFSGRFYAVQKSHPIQPGLIAAEHSLLVLKLKSGSAMSLHKVADSLTVSLKEKDGLLVTDADKIREMRRFVGV